MQGGPSEKVEVVMPPADLRGLVACAIFRQVVGSCADEPLRSDVQANGYACLNIICEGSVRARTIGLLPRVFIVGPLSEPLATEVTEPLCSASIVIQPWLLPCIAGVPVAGAVNRVLELHASTHGGLDEVEIAVREIWAGAGDSTRLWQALRALLGARGIPSVPRLALDVLVAAGVAAAAAQCGLGERQYRRRFVGHMGLAPSTWRRIARLEGVITRMMADRAEPLGELAASAGYADQAHLCRDARSLLHRSPKGLHHLLGGEGQLPWSLEPGRPIYSRPEREP
jgi:AraC-like DNA-binding protein